ncbi:MAG: DUF2971 domain-containing protein [Balneola sp.]|jgi:hypothetical protein
MKIENKRVSVFESKDEMKQDEIFHYTSVDSFSKIISNSSVHLTSSIYMNDGEELIWIKNILDHHHLESNNFKYNEDRVKQLLKMLDQIEEMEVFLFSFSKKKDLLSQWRGYADDSEGVSIGFNIEELVKELKSKRLRRSSGSVSITDMASFQLFSIEYDIIKQYEELKLDKNPKELHWNWIGSDFTWFKSVLSRFKSLSFKEEYEVRLSYLPVINVLKDGIRINGGLQDIFYKSKNGQLIPFFELKLKNMDKIISSITIGPNCRLTKSEIKRFLRTHKIYLDERKIYLSSSTYRNR